jgi:hypothetical protein
MFKVSKKSENFIDLGNDVFYECVKFQLKIPYILVGANVTELEI